MSPYTPIARLCALLLLPVSSIQPVSADDTKASPVDYLKQVKPILAENCVSCHGVDTQESGLRLDAGQLIHRGGNRGPAVKPGMSKQSLLIQAITQQGDVQAMPPEDKLSAEQIALLEKWVAQGAKYPATEKVTTPIPCASRISSSTAARAGASSVG